MMYPHLRTYPPPLQPNQTPTYVYSPPQYPSPVFTPVANSPTLQKRYYHAGGNTAANSSVVGLTGSPAGSVAGPNPSNPNPATSVAGPQSPSRPLVDHHLPQTVGVAGVYSYSTPGYAAAQPPVQYGLRYHHPAAKHHHHQHDLVDPQYSYVESNDPSQR
eukprot:TRINITY_DN1750_c0_g1_i1.p1 TRINITY_DN1750_c0_g1~~TRINITY_DN1750_c0_g1_i1.p1  ORF type:complete len:160 (-),score=30.60 TRINITY_DN1750_c0_g1_i1:84-563(-)